MSRVAKKNGRGDKILENWSCWNSNFKYLLHNTNSNLMQHVQDIKVTSLPYEKNCLECKILTINSNLVTIVVEIHHKHGKTTKPASFNARYKAWTSRNNKYKINF